VRDAIEDLYRAYAPVPLDPDVAFCDHCVTAEEVAALHAVPLREASAQQIGRLVFKGLNTWGDERYFRHFIPRMLELTVAGELSLFLPRKLAACLATGPAGERAAVDRFFTAWWADTLARYPAPVSAETVYAMITGAGWPGAPLLAAWPAAEPRHLALFVALHAYDHPPAEIAEWLGSGVPTALLTAVGNSTDDLELLEDVSLALEILANNY
jgi:hypothetical protein